MWVLNNTTPYAADRNWVLDKNGNKLWLVVVKATFDILRDGSCRLSPEQVPVLAMAKPAGEFGKSSLIYDADLLGVKPCSDILLHGRAWARNGARTGSVDVRMTLGSITKSLRIFGKRYWDRGIVAGAKISSPEVFESMPITYENAYGGWDRTSSDPRDHRLDGRNPVGTGYALRVENCIGKSLPNIEHPSHLIESWNDRPSPAGLNALDRAWSPRRELAGTYDESWREKRSPLWALDFDEHYNNFASTDQQFNGFLSGGEHVELVNLSPNAWLGFRLPRVHPVFRTRFGKERVEHPSHLCTVILEPDVPRVIMAWQTSLICNHRVDELDETIIREAHPHIGSY